MQDISSDLEVKEARKQRIQLTFEGSDLQVGVFCFASPNPDILLFC